jgi:protein-S-isoprenylcysteine O-methyltransferase Ste14
MPGGTKTAGERIGFGPQEKIMEQISYYTSVAAFVVFIGCWFVFAGTFLLRKKPKGEKASKRAPASLVGIVLQGIAFGLVWALRRPPMFSPIVESQFVLNVGLQILAVLMAVGSVWMATSAIRELGKQWSFQARLIEGHKLVTSGVYQIVRHPIYAAMLGLLASAGLVFSRWWVLPAAFVIFLVGTKIRTAAEEKLLRDAFPGEYDEYARKIPSFVPFVRI